MHSISGKRKVPVKQQVKRACLCCFSYGSLTKDKEKEFFLPIVITQKEVDRRDALDTSSHVGYQ
jgi:hypothetical protein